MATESKIPHKLTLDGMMIVAKAEFGDRGVVVYDGDRFLLGADQRPKWHPWAGPNAILRAARP